MLQDDIQVEFQEEVKPEGRGTPQPSIQQEHPSEVEPEQSPKTLTASGYYQQFSINMLQGVH